MNNLYSIGVIPGPLNEHEVLFNHNNFYPKYWTQHVCPYGYNTYGSNQHIKFGEDRNNNLDYMHNKSILGDYYTYLFCLFLQFCEAFKQLQ